MKNRATNAVWAQSVEASDRPNLQDMIGGATSSGATVYTNEVRAYQGMPFEQETVNRSADEYVRRQAHINGMESFWAMLKRGYLGTYHHMSPKHLDRYVSEFSGRHNDRDSDTMIQTEHIAAGVTGKRLRYRDLIARARLDFDIMKSH